MKLKWKSRVGAFALAVCVAFTAVPVFAEEESAKNIEIVLEDVTASHLSTLSGEAKIQVSVKGVSGSVTEAQAAFTFGGDLAYKSIEFLQGSNNYNAGDFQIATDPDVANKQKALSAGFISATPIALGETTAMFILTFEGAVSNSVTLTLDKAHTFCYIDGEKSYPKADTNLTVAATGEANKGKTATVKLTMDKVGGFTASTATAGGVIALTITNERTKAPMTINLNDSYRGSGTTAVYTISNSVLANDTYTVELSGLGYVPYKATGVTFDSVLELTNSDFVPGDVNKDEKVDETDRTEFKALTDNSEYSEAADFNRDGYVDSHDATVLDAILGADGKDDNNEGGSAGGTGSAGGSDSSGGSGSAGGAGGAGSSGGGGISGGISGGVSAGVTTPSTTETFTDLANYDWAKESIYNLKNKGIISGTSETTFSPKNPIKRGDFMLILARMLELSGDFTENFADVPAGSYYYDAIGRAKAAGIATGDGVNFMPENTITRQDLITLAYRAFLNAGYISEVTDTSVLDAFVDKDSISGYAKGAMASMVSAGIIKGADGYVNPLGNATRAEVAVMCARLTELMG